MRLTAYASGAHRRHRAFVRLTRALGAELDDVGKAALRRPDFFGRPFLNLAQMLLRGRSTWSVAEREYLATVVSRTNSCDFCVGTHGEIAAKQLDHNSANGDAGSRLAAAAAFLELLTRDPQSLSRAHLDQANAAGVNDDVLAEAIYIAFFFSVINRVADSLGFEHRSDRDRRRGADILRRAGYRLPWFLLAVRKPARQPMPSIRPLATNRSGPNDGNTAPTAGAGRRNRAPGPDHTPGFR